MLALGRRGQGVTPGCSTYGVTLGRSSSLWTCFCISKMGTTMRTWGWLLVHSVETPIWYVAQWYVEGIRNYSYFFLPWLSVIPNFCQIAFSPLSWQWNLLVRYFPVLLWDFTVCWLGFWILEVRRTLWITHWAYPVPYINGGHHIFCDLSLWISQASALENRLSRHMLMGCQSVVCSRRACRSDLKQPS